MKQPTSFKTAKLSHITAENPKHIINITKLEELAGFFRVQISCRNTILHYNKFWNSIEKSTGKHTLFGDRIEAFDKISRLMFLKIRYSYPTAYYRCSTGHVTVMILLFVTVSDSEDNLQKSLYEVRKISENVI